MEKMIGTGNRSTRRKIAPVQFYPPQIPHDLNRAPARAAEVRSWRVTARATARCRPPDILLPEERCLMGCYAVWLL
jgi:hypothetical protein